MPVLQPSVSVTSESTVTITPTTTGLSLIYFSDVCLPDACVPVSHGILYFAVWYVGVAAVRHEADYFLV